MTTGQGRRHASEGAEHVPAQVPRWLSPTVRLLVLLACLGLAIFALLTNDDSVLSPSHGSSASSPASASDATTIATCVPPTPPSLPYVSWRQIRALRVSVLALMKPLARSRYAWGIVGASAAWTDDLPASLRASGRDGLWPASFEMRSWTTDPQLAPALDDVSADVLLFTDLAQAREYFAQATSPRCHRDGSESPTTEPPQARNLTWINPDNAAQEDVFLLRGDRVYRVSDVRPAGADAQAGVARANALACALPQAKCRAHAT